MQKFITDLTSRESHPTRFRMGRMASAVVIPLQNLIRDLDANIPQFHALIEHPQQRSSTGSFSFMGSFGFGGGAGAGSRSSDYRYRQENRDLKKVNTTLTTRNQRLDEDVRRAEEDAKRAEERNQQLEENAKRAEERNQQLEEQLKRNAEQIRQLCERNSDEMLILDNNDEKEEEKTSGIYASQPSSAMFSQSSSSSSSLAPVCRDRSASVTEYTTGGSSSVSVSVNNSDERSATELANESETAYNLTNT